MPDQPQYHLDYTGTGNSLNILHPRAMGLVTDSLRYWVTDMHVDGFRFDLAPVLVRGYEAGQPSAFFEIIQQDPVLSKVKLIAEPWDASPDGYQLGQFPTGLVGMERGLPGLRPPILAGRPRPGPRAGVPPHRVERHLRAERAPHLRQHQLRHLSRRLHPHRPRQLRASKHNEANGEDNRDGAQDNASRNWGAEGPTDSARIQRARDRMKRNFLTTLLFAQGVPMLLGGDEIGRTQQGNNNAYCQDNEVSWFDWDIGESGWDMRDFVRDLIARPAGQPDPAPPRLLHRHRRCPGTPTKDVTWIRCQRAGDDRRRLGGPQQPEHRHAAVRPGRRRGGHPGPVGVRRTRCSSCSMPGPRSHSYTLPRMESPGPVGGAAQHGPARPLCARQVRNDAVNLTAHSSILLRHTERIEG